MIETPPPRSEQPAEGRQAWASWAVGLLAQITLKNILVLALLALVAVPSYFAWRFLSDEAFRHEFRTSIEVVDAGVPCLVLVGNAMNQGDRTTVAVSYALRNRLEYMIALRSPGRMSSGEISTACTAAHAEAKTMEAAHHPAAPPAHHPEP